MLCKKMYNLYIILLIVILVAGAAAYMYWGDKSEPMPAEAEDAEAPEARDEEEPEERECGFKSGFGTSCGRRKCYDCTSRHASSTANDEEYYVVGEYPSIEAVGTGTVHDPNITQRTCAYRPRLLTGCGI